MPPETDPIDPAAADTPPSTAASAEVPEAPTAHEVPEAPTAHEVPEAPTAHEVPEAPTAHEALEASDAPEAHETHEAHEAPDPGQPAPAAVPDMTAAVCAARLAELFPALFGADGPPRPVKLRVHADVQQRAPGVFTRRVLSTFLARHTTTSAYLRALVESPHRFDLDGLAAGEIADEHRQAAREELARRRALRRGPPGKAQRQAAEGTQAPTPPGVDSGPATGAPAPGRPPRGPRAEGPGRSGQPPRTAHPGDPGRPGRPDRPDRSDRPARPGRPDRPGRQERPPRAHAPAGAQRPDRSARPPRQGPFAAGPGADTHAADSRTPAAAFDPAQRARQTLVRAWESSPLAKPNFCALMRVSPAELDAAIEQVQQERRARAAAASG